MEATDYTPTREQLDATAIHEAGHAVLHICLGLGIEHVTIRPDFEDMSVGASVHGGEWPADEDAEALRLCAEDAFWLRHAVACYAGVEAVRQLRPQIDADDREAGAGSDYREATDAVNRITADPESIDLYFALAKRRCTVLVEHYAPEIEAVAAQLLERETLPGDEARTLVFESLRSRPARLQSW